MRLFLLSRHAESELNVARRVNGNPDVEVRLTETGIEEARRLGVQLTHVPVDLCIHTRFGRTRRTAELTLDGRDVEFRVEPGLDDIDVGDLDGYTIEDYRAWKRRHTRSDRFPGGESLDDAARRYADTFERLADDDGAACVLVVCHEIPIRYAINAAAAADSLDGPVHDIANATPYLFTASALALAAERVRTLVPAA